MANAGELLQRIASQQHQLQARGLWRQRQLTEPVVGSVRRVQRNGQQFIDFAGNDYLGLATHPQVITAQQQALQRYGCGSTASPLVSGYSNAHAQLEQQLCELSGHEAALLLPSGFAGNSALLKTLFTASDTVIADKLIHASMIDALRDRQVKLQRFAHNDLAHAEQLLIKTPRSALVTESVFSMDGDSAPLTELAALCQRCNSPLIVDDAHGFLLSDSLQVKPFARLVTFGKALGGQGAAILGSQQLIDYLVANAREYIYSTALAPAACAGVSQALQLAADGYLQQQLSQNIAYFRQACAAQGIALMPSNSAIQPLVLGDSERVMQVAARLARRGFLVGAIRPPTVPAGKGRLRLTLSAAHQPQQLLALATALAECCDDA
ncbi:aminotransferase class I/II-fold pyridoxal phosphate-dependent enzyme [Shewanella dokdonensis]|uniref:8-amino-7-oxononanoate synthase n=1 Tax=Shewanella dokdonensis TaxID=712036 RepID=A0ABX8DFL1_9GAMM|nr:8-amino-7-oxononanoate synthase [Shewanella dokdonensis]MCL1075119.1 8-amino-7-oxononanoate synthase [Shewanella dokdonensis]QVK23523.1 8-amino-7-oxononanoate synthase [Shewanella dokdonensis]